MGRDIKEGIESFLLKSTFFSDRDIKRLIRKHGSMGVIVYLFILGEIYRDKGYYIEYDKDFAFDISDSLPRNHEEYSEEFVQSVIDYCIELDLFDKELSLKNILTSRGIQKRYLLATKRRSLKIKDTYNLISVTENNIYDTEKEVSEPIIPDLNTQSTRINGINGIEENVFISEETKNIFLLFYFLNIKTPREETIRFWNHYSSSSWIDKNGNKITNKLAKAKSWTPSLKGLMTQPDVLQKWQQVFNLMLEKYPEKRFELLKFIPAYKGNQLILKYWTKNEKEFIQSRDLIEGELFKVFSTSVKIAFGKININYQL